MREHEDMQPGAGGRNFGQQAKMWIAIALAVYLIVLIALNSGTVQVKLLFTTLDMSLSILLLLCGALGFGVGWIVGRSARRRRRHD